MKVPPDPGVEVAAGDPGRISDAAQQHLALADSLDSHAGRIDAGAVSLEPVWNGQAAGAFRELSTLAAGAFRATAGASRSAAESLRSYANELERRQQEGKRALQQAEGWLKQAQDWQRKLTEAQTAAANAQTQVRQQEGAIACTVPGPAGAAARAAAQSAVTRARTALTKAQSDERTARQQLEHALDQLRHWQQVGHQVFEEAERAAERGVGGVQGACIAIPQIFQTPGVAPIARTSTGDTVINLVFGGHTLPTIVLGTGGYGASAAGGAERGVSGLASWAGRTLRTGATSEARSAASPVLRQAGSLAKDFEPIAKAAGWGGVALGVAGSLADGKSVPDTALHASLSTGGAIALGGLAGSACEAGTFGLGTPGCVVLGGAGEAAGSFLGNLAADAIDAVF